MLIPEKNGQFLNFGYKWRKEYGGLKVDQDKRLKELHKHFPNKGKRVRLLLSVMMFALLFSQLSAQRKKVQSDEEGTQRKNLAGTWRLIEYTDIDTVTGKWIHPYGKHPRGYFTYTRGGIVNLGISSEYPLAISEDSAYKRSFTLGEILDNYSVGYFGTYTIDHKNSTITHHPNGGAIPWYIGTDQHRQFKLKGDTLFIGDPTFEIGRRVLVREK